MNKKDMRQHWDRQAPIYASDEGHRPFDRYLALYEQSCWDYIEPTLPGAETSTILEAGCGTGRWVMHLAPRGYQMVLTDLSPEMIEHARQKVEDSGLSSHIEGYHVLDICELSTLSNASFELVLALGGPLTLCRDASMAINEFRRVTKPGGYIICDVANRYRTALQLVHEQNTDQILSLIDTGSFMRPDGLSDHRFSPSEITEIFVTQGTEVIHRVGICPFFDFLPTKDQVRILDDETVFTMMQDIRRRYAEDPSMLAISGRLLIVARKRE
jgi:ubiquinone/menaquinone biosynthesis C-methylase UbiE